MKEDPPPFYIKGRGEGMGVLKIFKKRGGGGSDFSHKNGGIGKIAVVALTKESITYFHTKCYLSECLVCVCVCVYVCVCVCVSQEEPSLIASNHQIYDFCK